MRRPKKTLLAATLYGNVGSEIQQAGWTQRAFTPTWFAIMSNERSLPYSKSKEMYEEPHLQKVWNVFLSNNTAVPMVLRHSPTVVSPLIVVFIVASHCRGGILCFDEKISIYLYLNTFLSPLCCCCYCYCFSHGAPSRHAKYRYELIIYSQAFRTTFAL